MFPSMTFPWMLSPASLSPPYVCVFVAIYGRMCRFFLYTGILYGDSAYCSSMGPFRPTLVDNAKQVLEWLRAVLNVAMMTRLPCSRDMLRASQVTLNEQSGTVWVETSTESSLADIMDALVTELPRSIQLVSPICFVGEQYFSFFMCMKPSGASQQLYPG